MSANALNRFVEAQACELFTRMRRMENQSEIRELKAEIERLNALITELADALVRVNYSWPNDYDADLLQRAREATK